MFLVDTSVWIDYLRGSANEPVQRLRHILDRGYPFGITGAIYQEILQGADSEASLETLKRRFGSQRFYHPLDPVATYASAAQIYFHCRRAGVTIRSTVDCLIAQLAIEHALVLLHNDKDFDRIGSVVPELSLDSAGQG